MNLETIGDQGSKKYDEGLVNQVNEQIEAQARREELEKRRANLQARQEAERKQKELYENKKTDLEETLERTIPSMDYSKNSNLEIPPIIADKTLINNYDLAKIGKINLGDRIIESLERRLKKGEIKNKNYTDLYNKFKER